MASIEPELDFTGTFAHHRSVTGHQERSTSNPPSRPRPPTLEGFSLFSVTTMKTSFWTYFTSAYGTFWLVLIGIGLITQSHLNAGLFGLIGFPIIALIYAMIRRSKDSEGSGTELTFLPPRMTEFLTAHPEFLNCPERIRNTAFHNWLNKPDLR